MTDITAITAITDEEASNRAPPAEALHDQLLARWARLLRELDEILASAETWRGPIHSKAEADAITNLENKIRSLVKEAGVAHAGEKLPFKLAVDVIDGFFKSRGIIGKAEAAAARVAPIRAAWQKADADAKKAQLAAEARAAQEAADRLRREEEAALAEERRQKAAREAARAEEARLATLRRNPNAAPLEPAPAPPEPRPEPARPSAADLLQEQADRLRAQSQAKPNTFSRIVTDLGASANLRQTPRANVVTQEMTDESWRKLAPHISIDHLREAGNRLAKVECREGAPLPSYPGLSFYWEIK